MSVAGKFRAKLIELWTRTIKLVERDDYYTNGEEDDYSRTIELAILNSPTGKRAWSVLSNFVSGEGVTNDFALYDDVHLSDVVNEIADNVAMHGGCWIHRSVKLGDNMKFVTDKIEVLDYHQMRFSKEDDDNNLGKIKQLDLDSKSWGRVEYQWFYPFSNNQNIIKAQIEADAENSELGDVELETKIENYRGQVMYINTTPQFRYALSPFDSVFNDLDTEYRISLYINKEWRTGLLGKQMILYDNMGDDENEEFEKTIMEWLGAENSSGVMAMPVENVEEISDFIHTIKLESNYNDDMYKSADERLKRNILGAASNLPESLAFSNDGSLFSGSGEQIRELIKFYSDQTLVYRKTINKSLLRLGFNCEIIPL